MIKVVSIILVIALISQCSLILILWKVVKKQELEINLLKQIIEKN